jgi:hypothetical protein
MPDLNDMLGIKPELRRKIVMPAQADIATSSAVDVATLVTDHNALVASHNTLLQKLRNAGLLEE